MEYLVKPWSHQEKAIERAKDMNSFAFLFEVGAGKTLAAICTLRHKFTQHKRLLKTIIFAPPIVLPVWREEFKKHSKINPNDIILLNGEGKKRIEIFKEKSVKPAIFVTNFESLTTVKGLFELFLAWEPEVLVFDESHKLKEGRSLRTKAAIKLARDVPYKYILTGTFSLNSALDIFSQMKVMLGGFPTLDGKFIKNYSEFRARYFIDKNAGMNKLNYFPSWQIKEGSLEEINQIIKKHGMRVKKSEVLDLPPLVKTKVYVEMSLEQKKHYENMKRDFITFVDMNRGKNVHPTENDVKASVGKIALEKALRLQQICSGFLGLVDGTIQKIKDNPRQKALKELLEDLTPEHKCLVWATFRENYEQIREVCEDLKIPYVECHGDVTDKQKYEAVENFNKDPKVRVFLGHPISGGIGISLIPASYSIYFSRNFSLEADIQSEARNYRGGSEIHEKVTRIDLVCPGTIDEAILKRLEEKILISEKIVGELRNEV